MNKVIYRVHTVDGKQYSFYADDIKYISIEHYKFDHPLQYVRDNGVTISLNPHNIVALIREPGDEKDNFDNEDPLGLGRDEEDYDEDLFYLGREDEDYI